MYYHFWNNNSSMSAANVPLSFLWRFKSCWPGATKWTKCWPLSSLYPNLQLQLQHLPYNCPIMPKDINPFLQEHYTRGNKHKGKGTDITICARSAKKKSSNTAIITSLIISRIVKWLLAKQRWHCKGIAPETLEADSEVVVVSDGSITCNIDDILR